MSQFWDSSRLRALSVVGLAVVAISCTSPAAAPTPTVRATVRPGGLDVAFGPVGVTQMAIVAFVVDGDTVRVQLNGDEFNEYAVRYIGIDAPERETEPLWAESAEANEELIEGREVFLEPDVSDTDQHGRLLRHVWLPTDDGWLNINAELVRLGMADARSYPPDTLWDSEYAAAESEARAARLGIWGLP